MESGPRTETPRRASEWGLVSLLIGLMLTIMFPLVFLTVGAGVFISLGIPYWPAEDLQLADNIAHGATYLLIGLAGFSVLIALFAILRALIGGLPKGLAIGGLVTSACSLVLMVFFLVALNRIAAQLWEEQPRRDGRAPAKKVDLRW